MKRRCRKCCYSNRDRGLLLDETSGRIIMTTGMTSKTYEGRYDRISVGFAEHVTSVTVSSESLSTCATIGLLLISVPTLMPGIPA
jgi:hypothetical protein